MTKRMKIPLIHNSVIPLDDDVYESYYDEYVRLIKLNEELPLEFLKENLNSKFYYDTMIDNIPSFIIRHEINKMVVSELINLKKLNGSI